MRKILRSQEINKLSEPVDIPGASFPQPQPVPEEQPPAQEENVQELPHVADERELIDKKLRECEAQCAEALRRADEQANGIVEAAKAEAALILEKAADEKKDIFEKAFTEGLQTAITRKTEAVDEALSSLAENLVQLRAAQEDYFAQYERQLSALAADIAEKLLAQRIASDDLALLALIKATLKTMRDSEYVTVTVAQRHTELIEALQQELPSLNMDKYTEILASADMPDDGVFIESENGAVNASISVQLANLREFLGRQGGGSQ